MNCPYSVVDNILVNIGVVIKDIPLCKKEHIRKTNEALTGIGIFLNISKICFKFKHTPSTFFQHDSYFLLNFTNLFISIKENFLIL